MSSEVPEAITWANESERASLQRNGKVVAILNLFCLTPLIISKPGCCQNSELRNRLLHPRLPVPVMRAPRSIINHNNARPLLSHLPLCVADIIFAARGYGAGVGLPLPNCTAHSKPLIFLGQTKIDTYRTSTLSTPARKNLVLAQFSSHATNSESVQLQHISSAVTRL